VLHRNWICISSRLRDIEPETYWGHNTHYVITWRFDSPYAVSYWCFIETEPLSPSVFELFDSKYIWVTTLTFWGHVTSSSIWPFDAPHSISYRCSTVTDSYLQPFSRYRALNILGSRPWPSRSRDMIGHVTIRFSICGFLLVLHCN